MLEIGSTNLEYVDRAIYQQRTVNDIRLDSKWRRNLVSRATTMPCQCMLIGMTILALWGLLCKTNDSRFGLANYCVSA